MIHHPLNFAFGWWMILVGFTIGAGLGLFFQREDFWGGYASFRRRIFRLGHIACVALGALNILFAISPVLTAGGSWAKWASGLLIAGAIAMPAVCFLSAWKKPLACLFCIPVSSLMSAVAIVAIAASR